MKKEHLCLLQIGLLLYRDKIQKMLENGNGSLMLGEKEGYAFVSFLLSGVYDDVLLEEVCGISQTLCTAVRRRFPN